MRILPNIRSTLHPEAYHGDRAGRPFFEGWYLKLVDPGGHHPVAVIPGIFLSEDPAQEHAFVQILEGHTRQVTYHRFPVSDFSAATDRFDVRIGASRFWEEGVHLDIDRPDQILRGTVTFGSLAPWPVTVWSPGIMGWYAWMPFMECYHGVLSLDHALRGSLSTGAHEWGFDGGRGYIEKDWGRSFPQTWVWLQTNHFGQDGIGVSASVAHIPFLRTTFPGFIIGFWHQGTLYRFTTYTGAKLIRLDVTDEAVDWLVRDRAYELRLKATRTDGALLYAPAPTGMAPRVEESMHARVEVTLVDRRSRATVFEGEGLHAGLEVHGDTSILQPDRPGT